MSGCSYPFAKLLQNVYFNQGLLMESLLVADDFYGDQDARLVIDTPDHLPKTSLAKDINDFVSIGEMVAWDDGVVAPLVVVAKVGGGRLHVTDHFGGVLGPAEVDVLVIHNFTTLVDVENGNPDGVLRADALFGRGPFPKGIQRPGGDLGLLPSQPQLLHLLLGHHVILV